MQNHTDCLQTLKEKHTDILNKIKAAERTASPNQRLVDHEIQLRTLIQKRARANSDASSPLSILTTHSPFSTESSPRTRTLSSPSIEIKKIRQSPSMFMPPEMNSPSPRWIDKSHLDAMTFFHSKAPSESPLMTSAIMVDEAPTQDPTLSSDTGSENPSDTESENQFDLAL